MPYYGARIILQGGHTGLVGGSIPQSRSVGQDCVILFARRLTGLRPVDPRAGQVTAGAGITVAQLAAHAAAAGWRYAIDLASRDSATVGGTIATNAGGIHTIRYGPTRSQVAGLVAVLADGSVVGSLAGLTAGITGYDLTQLLIGSEGTLAVITEARLVLRPAEPAAAVLLAGTSGIAAAAELLGHIREVIPTCWQGTSTPPVSPSYARRPAHDADHGVARGISARRDRGTARPRMLMRLGWSGWTSSTSPRHRCRAGRKTAWPRCGRTGNG